MGSRLTFMLFICAPVVAQEDASGIARSGVGEIAATDMRVGPCSPVALAWIDGGRATASVVPALYGIDDLRRAGIQLVQNIRGFGTAVSINVLRAGSSHCLGVRTSVGFRPDEEIGLGADLQVSRWTFPRYDRRYEWALGVGLAIRSGPATCSGLIRSTAQQGRAISLQDLTAGVACSIESGKDLELTVECVQESFVPISIRFAAVAEPMRGVTLILSWAESPGIVGGGIGCEVSGWSALFGAQWHPILGWSQALDLHLSWD